MDIKEELLKLEIEKLKLEIKNCEIRIEDFTQQLNELKKPNKKTNLVDPLTGKLLS